MDLESHSSADGGVFSGALALLLFLRASSGSGFVLSRRFDSFRAPALWPHCPTPSLQRVGSRLWRVASLHIALWEWHLCLGLQDEKFNFPDIAKLGAKACEF